jgi:hypothetical protein
MSGAGHNAGARPELQWQVPHRHAHGDPAHDHGPDDGGDLGAAEPDFDLVEAAFVEHFDRASDPTSFLRLAGVPFQGRATDGRRLSLLRVEQEALTDVASVTPQLGGAPPRHDPLPAAMVSKRRRLRFVYLDGETPHRLTLAEAKALRPVG